MKANRTYELGKRLLVTILILVIYMAGRSILLYCVDPAAYQLEELDTQNIMASMISGDRYQYTVFALGVMPYIMSSLLMWLYAAIRGSDYKSRISPRKMSQATLALMMVIASVSALSRAGDLVFQESALDAQVLRAIAVAEMVAGVAVIYGMASFNKERGIGGQMPIILVNIVDNLALTIQRSAPEQLKRPAVLCLIMVIIILAMENVIIRIPVQRVSIHNDYAKDSYIPLKSDPIGVMPIMFAVSFLMILRFLVRLLLYIFEDSQRLQLFYDRLELTNAAGAGVYLGIVFALNILFSFIMISPGEMAENLQKGGDSIVNVYAGKKTKRYLRKKLLLLDIFSGLVFCLMMGSSLTLALRGELSSELALLPSRAMILTGITLTLLREIRAYWKFDSYSFFI